MGVEQPGQREQGQGAAVRPRGRALVLGDGRRGPGPPSTEEGDRPRPVRDPPVRRVRPPGLGRIAGAREGPAPVTALAAAGRRGRGDRLVRGLRAAAAGNDAAGGERRHRQDLHHRGAHGPLRRGRRPADRPSPRHHLHPDGHGRAPRAGARPPGARLRRLGRRPGRTAATAGRRHRAAAGGRAARRAGAARATGWARRSPTSTPPPSRRPTGSACRSSTASAPRATSTAR